MDLEGFDVETFMEMVNAAGLKFHKTCDEREDGPCTGQKVTLKEAWDDTTGKMYIHNLTYSITYMLLQFFQVVAKEVVFLCHKSVILIRV